MGSELKVTLWASRTPEQFILHVCSMIHECKLMEHDVKFSRAEEATATAMLNLEIMEDEYAQVHNLEKKGKREQMRKHFCSLQFRRGCKVGLSKSNTCCRCLKDLPYNGRSKGL